MNRRWTGGELVRLPRIPKGVDLPNDRGKVLGTSETDGKVIVEVRPPRRAGDDESRAKPKYATAESSELIEVADLNP